MVSVLVEPLLPLVVTDLWVIKSVSLSVVSGLYYTQRGAKDNEWEITHNNFEIPILVKYGFKVSDDIALLPFVGPYFAYAISKEEKYKGHDVSASYPRVNRNNVGFKLGCGAEYHKLYIEAGYQFGVTNILDSDDLSARNNALFANLGINF